MNDEPWPLHIFKLILLSKLQKVLAIAHYSFKSYELYNKMVKLYLQKSPLYRFQWHWNTLSGVILICDSIITNMNWLSSVEDLSRLKPMLISLKTDYFLDYICIILRELVILQIYTILTITDIMENLRHKKIGR